MTLSLSFTKISSLSRVLPRQIACESIAGAGTVKSDVISDKFLDAFHTPERFDHLFALALVHASGPAGPASILRATSSKGAGEGLARGWVGGGSGVGRENSGNFAEKHEIGAEEPESTVQTPVRSHQPSLVSFDLSQVQLDSEIFPPSLPAAPSRPGGCKSQRSPPLTPLLPTYSGDSL